VQLVTPLEINLELEVLEDGNTMRRTPEEKALAFAQATRPGLPGRRPSGLEVEALGGAPGPLFGALFVQTWRNRCRPPRPSFKKSGGIKPEAVVGRGFRATVAIAVPGQRVQLAEGDCRGEIIPEERGTGGFGYDPIFFIPELGRTMAELDMDEKNRVSHRDQGHDECQTVLEKLDLRGPV